MEQTINLSHGKQVTEDVGVLEIDGLLVDGVGGVEQHLALPIELNCIWGFVDSGSGGHGRLVLNFLHLHSYILLVHVFDVVHREPGRPSLQSSAASTQQ